MPFDDYDHILPNSSFSIELDNDPDLRIMSEHSSIPRIAASEFLGTMIRVLFASSIASQFLICGFPPGPGGGYMSILCGHFIGIITGVWTVRHSDAHLSPVLTMILLLLGRFSWMHAPIYITSQLCGGLTAMLILWGRFIAISTSIPEPKASIPYSFPGYFPAFACFVYEVIGSGLILIALLSTLNRRSPTRRSSLVPLMIYIHVAELIFWTTIDDVLADKQGGFFCLSLPFCWHQSS